MNDDAEKWQTGIDPRDSRRASKEGPTFGPTFGAEDIEMSRQRIEG